MEECAAEKDKAFLETKMVNWFYRMNRSSWRPTPRSIKSLVNRHRMVCLLFGELKGLSHEFRERRSSFG